MAQQKIKVLVMFGGRSPEHDVSIITGLQILEALDPELYETIPLYITTSGKWLTGDLLRKRIFYLPSEQTINTCTEVTPYIGNQKQPYLQITPKSWFGSTKTIPFDIALPAFHGLNGEDGPLQGLLDIANIPYTGMRLLASSVLMDKIATKKILAETDIPLLPYWEIKRPSQGLMLSMAELQAIKPSNLIFPCCIKPAHLGSSIGVARVESLQEIADVLPSLFRYDDTAMVEPFVDNLVEYNVAVRMTKEGVQTSAIERPKHTSELLDFKTKYMPGGVKDGGKLGGKLGGTKSANAGESSSQGMLSLTRDINPNISKVLENNLRNWAIEAFLQVDGTGTPRIDFLCNSETGKAWFNEANPCPGSFAFFLWEAADQPALLPELLDDLIQEGFDRHARKQIPDDPTPEDAQLFKRKK